MKRLSDNISVYISQLQNEGYTRNGKEVWNALATWLVFCALALVAVLLVFAPAWF